VRRRGKRPPFAALLAVIAQHEIGEIVVGLPLTLAGDDSEWTREVRTFAAALAQRTGLNVSLMDERLSSVRAERIVRSLGLPRARREQKERIDAAAAVVILQAFLDSRAARENEYDESET
jgi:putative holliday junction resolvase